MTLDNLIATLERHVKEAYSIQVSHVYHKRARPGAPGVKPILAGWKWHVDIELDDGGIVNEEGESLWGVTREAHRKFLDWLKRFGGIGG